MDMNPMLLIGMDPLYVALLIIASIISFVASLIVKSTFGNASKVPILSGYTGAQIAKEVLESAGIDDVSIHEHQGFLSDHYNPLDKTLNLSPSVFNGRSAASAGVAAHEAGHAIQHAQNYFPMWVRSAIVPVAGIGSNIGIWLVILGILLGAAEGAAIGHGLAVAGVALFGMTTVFTLVTVPVEFNASSRAKERLQQLGLVQKGHEADAVSSVLTAAGLTYIAAAINSIMMLIYWAAKAGLIGGNGGRKN